MPKHGSFNVCITSIEIDAAWEASTFNLSGSRGQVAPAKIRQGQQLIVEPAWCGAAGTLLATGEWARAVRSIRGSSVDLGRSPKVYVSFRPFRGAHERANGPLATAQTAS